MTDANNQQKDAIQITAEIGTTKEISAPVEITSCKIEGNTMFLTVSYSGGCKDHSFKVIGSPSISKSLPPYRSVQVFHDNNEDSCRELITKNLEVDISALAYIQNPGSVIYLTLGGWEERVTYTFAK